MKSRSNGLLFRHLKVATHFRKKVRKLVMERNERERKKERVRERLCIRYTKRESKRGCTNKREIVSE